MQNPVKSAGLIPDVIRNARLAWRLFRDPRVSNMTKLVIPGLAAAYLLLPFDLMPDFVPVLGQLDDLALVAVGMKFFVDMCPAWLVQLHRDEMNGVGSTSTDPTNQGRKATVDADYRVIE
jgi:uncharacterized membrane protein YkvA (DUF1232 family)